MLRCRRRYKRRSRGPGVLVPPPALPCLYKRCGSRRTRYKLVDLSTIMAAPRPPVPWEQRACHGCAADVLWPSDDPEEAQCITCWDREADEMFSAAAHDGRSIPTRGNRYATDQERRDAILRSKREYNRRVRAAARRLIHGPYAGSMAG